MHDSKPNYCSQYGLPTELTNNNEMQAPQVMPMAFGLELYNSDKDLTFVAKELTHESGNYTFVSANTWIAAHKDERIRMLFEKSKRIFADGVGTVIASKLHSGVGPTRIPGPDFAHAALKEWKDIPMVFIGGSPATIKKIIKRFGLSRATHIEYGFCDPTPEYVESILLQVKRGPLGPKIVWLGFGCPRQELFAYYAMGKLKGKKVLTVGAAFDFLSEEKKRAPQLFRKFGMEWSYRLCQEPKRLFKRYVWGNAYLLYITMVYMMKHQNRYYEPFKRFLDAIASSFLLVLTSPLLFLAGLGILLIDGRPIIYTQLRMGKNKIPFNFYKFRTMHNGSENLQNALEEQNEMEGGIIFKIEKDPRITKFGRLLRRWSIDELPQLVNVLQGKMSLVGPRPPIVRETKKYSKEQMEKFVVTPGITGIWQVSGRSLLPFKEQVNLDLKYIKERSLLLDLKILLKTIPTIISGKGAY